MFSYFLIIVFNIFFTAIALAGCLLEENKPPLKIKA